MGIAANLASGTPDTWQRIDTEFFEAGGRYFAFTPHGVFMYDNHRNATIYLHEDFALQFAHEIIKRYAR